MKRISLILLTVVPLVALVAGAPNRATEADPVAAFSALKSSSTFEVRRSAAGLEIGDLRSDRRLFALTWEGVASLDATLAPPLEGEQAHVEELLGETGEVDLTLAETARGARLLVTRPGVIHARGLHVLLFDNDDLHVSDGDGAVIYTRRTTPDGALVEQEGPAGCHCLRTTTTSGHVSVEPR